MQLSAAIVVLAATLPHAVVWSPVGALHVEHQVLNEVDLVRGVNNLFQDQREEHRMMKPAAWEISAFCLTGKVGTVLSILSCWKGWDRSQYCVLLERLGQS